MFCNGQFFLKLVKFPQVLHGTFNFIFRKHAILHVNTFYLELIGAYFFIF